MKWFLKWTSVGLAALLVAAVIGMSLDTSKTKSATQAGPSSQNMQLPGAEPKTARNPLEAAQSAL